MIEVHGLQIPELVEIGEEEVAAFRDSFTDSFVEGDDTSMLGFSLGRELLQYVALIGFEFFGSMSEDEEVSIPGKVECNGPVSMTDDRFGRIFNSKFKFDKVSEGFCPLVVSGSGVETGEDVIEVDGFTLDEVKPLRVWESGASGGVNNARFDLLWVNQPRLQ